MSEPLLVPFKYGAFTIIASVKDFNNAGENDPDAIIAYAVYITCNGVDIPFSDLCRSAQIDMKQGAIKEYIKIKATMKQTQQVTIKWPNDGYGLQDYIVIATVHGNDQPGDFDPKSEPSVNITHVMYNDDNLVSVITETQERLMKAEILEKAASLDSVHEQNFPNQ